MSRQLPSPRDWLRVASKRKEIILRLRREERRTVRSIIEIMGYRSMGYVGRVLSEAKRIDVQGPTEDRMAIDQRDSGDG